MTKKEFKNYERIIKGEIKEHYKKLSTEKLADIKIIYDDVLKYWVIEVISISKNHVAYRRLYTWNLYGSINLEKTIDIM